MDVLVLIPALALVTLLAVSVFGYVSAQKAEERRRDPSAPKSTLAADAPSKGTPADV